jgi:hypothetical protein
MKLFVALFFCSFSSSSRSSVANMLVSLALWSSVLLILPVGAHPKPSHQSNCLGAVASESDTCSKVGIEILKEGGNAADAVSAPQGCLRSC